LVFRHNVEQGIRATEGAAAFERALSCYHSPELVISALDVVQLQQQMETMSTIMLRTTGNDAGLVFARPQLDLAYVAPRDAIEQSLVELWQELLGLSQVGVHDNFFELGGHSLVAVRLFARIRKLFSVDLPISVLFSAQTVEAGAALIRPLITGSDGAASAPGALPSEYTYLVPMHPITSDAATPFFLVAGMFGNVLNLRHLANQIGVDRPFYGLQARGLFGGVLPHETFEEMAEAYLEEIRQVQPHGPFLLGGFSGGGITALEISRQLIAAGETVSLLAMLDTPAPTRDDTLSAVDRVTIQLQNLRRDKGAFVTTWWRDRSAWKRAMRAKGADTGNHETGALHNAEIESAFYGALGRYTLTRYPGDITLYRPHRRVAHRLRGGRLLDDERNFVRDDNGWTSFCERLTVIQMPGDHDSMVLEPNVRVLAARLRAALDEAER
jgi:thioesterase domain-containing protein/acyl carrier protein